MYLLCPAPGVAPSPALVHPRKPLWLEWKDQGREKSQRLTKKYLVVDRVGPGEQRCGSKLSKCDGQSWPGGLGAADGEWA